MCTLRQVPSFVRALVIISGADAPAQAAPLQLISNEGSDPVHRKTLHRCPYKKLRDPGAVTLMEQLLNVLTTLTNILWVPAIVCILWFLSRHRWSTAPWAKTADYAATFIMLASAIALSMITFLRLRHY